MRTYHGFDTWMDHRRLARGLPRRRRPDDLIGDLLSRLETDDAAWISRLGDAGLAAALEALAERLHAVGGDLEQLPLYGVPCAVKDNIDARGFDTTAACPAFAYTPERDATVVARLRPPGPW